MTVCDVWCVVGGVVWSDGMRRLVCCWGCSVE